MKENTQEDTDILGYVTAGLIFIMFAILFVIIPNLIGEFSLFFFDLTFTQVTPLFWFWLPNSPHPVLYNAFFLLFLGVTIINLIVLVLRLIFRDTTHRVLESFGGIIFAAGTTWAAYSLLNGYMIFSVFFGHLVLFGGVGLVISSLGFITVKSIEK
ncbi:MAG: hypothetical protein ACFFDP_08240 [Promethearchaeota archaeon]